MFNFASESSIHGITFIFGENRSKLVRILWIFLLFASLCGFSYYFKLAYTKWSVAPDITIKISNKLSKDFPLTAITVCPNRFSREHQINFNKFVSAAQENKIFNATQAECEYLYSNLNWCGPAVLMSYMNTFCKNHFTHLEKINIVEVVNKSAYHNEELIIQEISNNFTRVFTHLGVCFTLNMQDFSAIFSENIHDDFKCYKNQKHPEIEWNVERGYFSENATYPESASRNAFAIAIMMEPPDANNPCFTKTVKLIFHLSNEMPSEQHKALTFRVGTQTTIFFSAKSHRTNDNLRSYSSEIRKCYFDGERKLELFNTYTVSHCLAECRTNVMIKACGCVKFFMPRNKTTRVCRLSDMKCVNKKEAIMQEEDRLACGCLRSCNDIEYSLTTDERDMDQKLFKVDDNDLISTMWLITSNADAIEEIENFLTYTLANFVSDVGGLLGLFLGCSLLSIMEIFFFLFASLIRALMKYIGKQEEDVAATEDAKILLLKLNKKFDDHSSRVDEIIKKIHARIENFEANSSKVEDHEGNFEKKFQNLRH